MLLDFNPQKFCDFSGKRGEVALKNSNNILAAAYKNRRLQLNMTLDAATKDICSKAYLCKFENNQLTMDGAIAKALCERVTLDYDKIVNFTNNNSLSSGVRMYLFNQFEQIEGLIETIDDDCFIASNKLLELLLALAYNNYDRCEELIACIDKVRSSLSDYEFASFTICICEYFIKTNQFLKAKSFINKLKYEITFKELKFLYLEQCFNIYFNLGELKNAFNAYKALEKEFSNGFPKKREFLDKLHYLEIFSSKETIQDLKDMLDDLIPDEYIEEYWYSYTLCLIKNGNYEECMRIIQEYNLNEAKFVAVFTYAASMHARMLPKGASDKASLAKRLPLKTISYINEMAEKMDKSHHNLIDRNFIKLMQLELVTTDSEELVNYIREVAIKYDKNYQHRFYSYIYAHHLFNYLGSLTRYKEAYLIAKNDRAFIN